MPRRLSISFVSLLLCGLASVTQGQGTKADYERATKLRRLTAGKVLRAKVTPHWFANNARFWYRNDLSDGRREFIAVHAKSGKRAAAFDHEALAAALSKVTENEVDASRLPIKEIEFSKNLKAVTFTAFESRWNYSVDKQVVTTAAHDSDASLSNPRQNRNDRPRDEESPNGKWKAFVRDHNVFIRDTDSNSEHALTTDGSLSAEYRRPLVWSPDSKRLVAMHRKEGFDRKIHLIEAAPKDQLQPKLHAMRYLKPGDDIPHTKPHLFDVDAKREIVLSDELFPNPWAIDRVAWDKDSQRFTFLYNQRGHQLLRVIAVDATTGECGVLLEERSDTFVDYAYKTYFNRLPDSHEILWMSERDGWNHLYLYDSQTGSMKNQITRSKWMVRRVEHVDSDKQRIWFVASGVFPEQDPYYEHYCRVNFDGTGFKVLTRGNGTHSIQLSPDRKFFIDTYSRVDMPPVTELRRTANGKLVCEVERADWAPLLATGWKPPERFVAKGRDGETDIYGVIWRPTNFDPSKTYPVIENIYAGPHGAFVPKRFASHYKAQELAELGFIVVKMDGMGTNWRRKKFHDVCWKNLGDSGFPDRIAWIKAAAAKYLYMDLNRVGIYGGSAGGQSSTRAMLAHGNFYKVAVSDCGCHDNRMDKIWWNELWMGWPLGPHYEEQSNVTNAHKLTGKLFLVVGAMDRNVDPASTMQVVDALIKADKDFDLLVVPNGGHGIAESAYGTRRRRDFFVRHLLGVEPRSN